MDNLYITNKDLTYADVNHMRGESVANDEVAVPCGTHVRKSASKDFIKGQFFYKADDGHIYHVATKHVNRYVNEDDLYDVYKFITDYIGEYWRVSGEIVHYEAGDDHIKLVSKHGVWGEIEVKRNEDKTWIVFDREEYEITSFGAMLMRLMMNFEKEEENG